MSVRRLFPVILLLAALAVTHVSAAVDYFPLYKGMYATYRRWDPGSGYSFYSCGVSSTKVIGGTTAYVVSNADGDDPAKGYLALAKDQGAVKVYETYTPGDGVYTFGTPQTFMKTSPSVGDHWIYLRPDGVQVTVTVLASNETAETLAGIFRNCLKIKEQAATGSYNYHWFAPGVGEVKFQDFDAPTYLKEEEEIVSFTRGASCDGTPPGTPIVIDDGADTHGNMLHGIWMSADRESGVVEYRVAVSTSPDESGIIPQIGWQSVGGLTECTTPPIPLLIGGATYYALVKARNGAGLWSGIGVSDGATVRVTPLGDSPWPMEVGDQFAYQIGSTDHGPRVGLIDVPYCKRVGDQTRFVSQLREYYRPGDARQMTGAWVGPNLMMYELGGAAIDPPMAFMQMPFTVGKDWVVVDPGGTSTTFLVLSDSETVVAPAGTFTGCVKIQQTWQGNLQARDFFYFKPGIGTVMTESYDSPTLLDERRRLSGWHLHPGPSDYTPPAIPTVFDDGSDSYGDVLKATWTSSDPESVVPEYMAAVSTTPDAGGVLPEAQWMSVGASTSWSSPPLTSVADGTVCYVLVKARNSAGLWSEIGASDGITIHSRIPSDSCLPLHLGNVWRYSRHDYMTGLDAIYEARVAGSAAVQGDLAFHLEGLRGECELIVCGDQPDGWYVYETDGAPYIPPWRQMTYPLSEGQQSVRNGATVTIEDLHDTATVPAGTFQSCLRLRVDIPGGTRLLDWLAPGVGLVHEEVYQGTTTISSQSLTGYYLLPTDEAIGLKEHPDGTPVLLTGDVVTASWPDAFYLESDDQSSGIRVEKAGHGLYRYDRADVSGVLRTNDDGERYIDASDAVYSGSGTIRPMGVIARDLGGSDWRYQPATGAGQRGVTNGTGLNNIGLFVRTWGRVKDLDSGPEPFWFVIDDGSGVDVRCETPSGVTLQMDSVMQVTGISRLFKVGEQYLRRISISDADDITVLKEDPPAAPSFIIGMVDDDSPSDPCYLLSSWPAFATSMRLYRSPNGINGWARVTAEVQRSFEAGGSYGSITVPGENAYYRMTGVNSGGEGPPSQIVHTRPAQVEMNGVICDTPADGAIDVSPTPAFSWHAAWSQPTPVKYYVCQLDAVSGIEYWPIWRVLTALTPPQTSVMYGQTSDVVVSLPASGLVFDTLYQWDVCAVDVENFIFAQSQKSRFTTAHLDIGPPPPPP